MRSALVVLAILATSCALTSKAPPVDIRWFSPERLDARDGPSPIQRDPSTAIPLCLGRLTSSAFLRNRIVYRRSAHELGTYDDQRWTEYPEVYLRRTLDGVLFDTARFVQKRKSSCPTLDVELLAFEEVRRGDRQFGRVQIRFRLQEDEPALSETLSVEAPAGSGMPAVAKAIGIALETAVARIADGVEMRLAPPVARGGGEAAEHANQR